MEIGKYFERDTIEEHDVFLSDDEEIALLSELKKLTEMQLGEGEQYEVGAAIELAGLAFVAGRAYQSEIEGDFRTLEVQEDETTVTVELSKATVEALLARVVAERLGLQ